MVANLESSLMNLQAEKLRLIEWLVQTQDVHIISRIAEFMKQTQATGPEASLKPMTMDELRARLEESEADLAAGRVRDLEEVWQSFGE